MSAVSSVLKARDLRLKKAKQRQKSYLKKQSLKALMHGERPKPAVATPAEAIQEAACPTNGRIENSQEDGTLDGITLPQAESQDIHFATLTRIN